MTGRAKLKQNTAPSKMSSRHFESLDDNLTDTDSFQTTKICQLLISFHLNEREWLWKALDVSLLWLAGISL